MSDVRSFLDQSSGSRYPAWKWDKEPGLVLTGTLIDTPRVINRENLNGDPEDNLVINVRTPDGPEFTLWVRRGLLAQAIAEAVKDGGADGLAEGGTLHVKHTANRDTGRPSPAREFKAKYTPPAPATVKVDDIFGEEEAPF